MTCPLSLAILGIVMFVTISQHATVPSDSNRNDLRPGMANLNPLTSHILDTSRGLPAPGVKTTLHKMNKETNTWDFISEQLTNQDGRVGNIISSEEFTQGVYKLNFDTKPYFESLDLETFYPYVEVVFEIKKPEEHYHVPIIVNPYGYSTYRGS